MIPGIMGGPRHRARRMLDLLSEERALILAGDTPKLAEMERRRAAAEADLMAAEPGPDAEADEELAGLVREIRDVAAENLQLLRAYMDGVNDGRRRVEAIDAAGRELGAYDPTGARLMTPAPPRRDTRA